MRSLAAAVTTALAARTLVARNFFWITARDPNAGNAPVSVGFWNGLDTITVQVIDGLTGSTVSRSFTGSGSLISLPDIPLTSDVAVRTISAALAANTAVEAAVRGYDIRRAPIQVYRGLFSLTSMTLVSPAVCRFVGTIDAPKIRTPKEGAFGAIEIELVSITRELTRASTEKRSDESQKARFTGDRFNRYTGVMPNVTLFWGQKRSVANLRQLNRAKRKKG